VANPSPAKVSAECPHCGFKQMEYAAAKSSLCRQCGRSFTPFAPKPVLKLRTTEEAAPPETSSSIFGKLEDFWKRQTTSVIECFECKRKQQVSGAATSTICPSCSSHIDLRDYKITSGFSRSIRTRGNVQLSGKGDLGSSSVVCQSALIEGRLRGNLECDTATINYSGKIPGRISARLVVVERKADVHCFRRVCAEHVEIKGRMSGEIVAQSVTVHRKGALEGDVTARAITVDKGGMFSGQLAIGQIGLAQGELLAKQEPAVSRPTESGFQDAVARPLPAT
jgi:cytoskeletal protein CcmA (bactofilin family)/DNA-directed RNA polymerase subunit RPC12/RpoP